MGIAILSSTIKHQPISLGSIVTQPQTINDSQSYLDKLFGTVAYIIAYSLL